MRRVFSLRENIYLNFMSRIDACANILHAQQSLKFFFEPLRILLKSLHAFFDKVQTIPKYMQAYPQRGYAEILIQ